MSVGHLVYVCGGLDYSMNTLNSCEMFDSHSNTWSWTRSMNEKRSWMQLLAVNQRLYAIGGHNGSHILDSIETFEPDSDSSWKTLEYRLVTPSITHAAVTVPLDKHS